MWISIKEASELTGIPDSTIRLYIDEGKVNVKKGDVILIDKLSILLQRPTILTLFNNKGGVGKTTMATLLADYFEKNQRKILLVDLDPQGNLSRNYFKDELLLSKNSFYDFMQHNTSFKKIVLPFNEYVDVLPSSMRMDELAGVDTMYWDERREEIEKLFKKYEIVILDAPPAINAFSRLSLLMCHYALIPVIADRFSLDGLKIVLKQFANLKKYNQSYQGYKAFISSYTKRNEKIKQDVAEMFKQTLENRIFEHNLAKFIGLEERQWTKVNLFDMYSDKHPQMLRINKLLNEINEFIFLERGVNKNG